MSMITDLARQGKDRAISSALELLGRQFVSRYGTLSDVRLDSRDRTIEIHVLLRGESVPVRILIDRYDIVTEGEDSYIVLSGIAVSREWMKTLAEDYLCGKRFKIPRKYAKILDSII